MIHLLASLALLFSPPQAKPDCREIEALTGGVELAWLGYPQGWALPEDLEMTSRIDFADGGLWEYAAESEPGVRYLWWFGDYVVDGTPAGMHNFCAVVVYDA